MTPEPFGYFNNPCFDGWQDCAETDEGARPLYDQDTVDALIAEHADIATLEQEARQMRARMERLEKERDDLLAEFNAYKEGSEEAFGTVVAQKQAAEALLQTMQLTIASQQDVICDFREQRDDLLKVAQCILAEDMLQYLPAEYVANVRAVIVSAKGSAA